MSRVERRSEEGSARGRETLEFEEDCREYHDDEFKIKLCNFYLHLGKRISDMGYSTSEYRISLHECREKTEVGKSSFRGKTYSMGAENFTEFDFPQLGTNSSYMNRPFGLWFSNFYKPEDFESDDSWINYCIHRYPKWVDPRSCKFILISKINNETTLSLNYRNNEEIFSKYSVISMGAKKLDWSKIKKDYPGGFQLLSVVNELHYLDVVSYVAWNHVGLEDIRVFDISFFQDLIDEYINSDLVARDTSALKNMRGKNFTRKIFTYDVYYDSPLKLKTQFSNVDLTGAIFKDAFLSGLEMKNSILVNVDFTGTNLQHIDFTNSNLSNANFNNSDGLLNCNFTNCTMRGAKFVKTELIDMDLTGINLTEITFEDSFLYNLKIDLIYKEYLEQEELDNELIEIEYV